MAQAIKNSPLVAIAIVATALATFVLTKATQDRFLREPGIRHQMMSSAFSKLLQDGIDSKDYTVSVESWHLVSDARRITAGTHFVVWDSYSCTVVKEGGWSSSADSSHEAIKKSLESPRKDLPPSRYLFVTSSVDKILMPSSFTGRIFVHGPKDMWQDDFLQEGKGTFRGVQIFINGQVMSIDQKRFESFASLY